MAVADGDRVWLTWDLDRRGTVRRAGPEQSEVRWDGEKGERVHVNGELVRGVERKRVRRKAE